MLMKSRSNLNVFMSIYVTLYNFNGWYIKKYGFEIPSRDFKSIKINCNNGLKLFTRIRTPLMALCNENTNHFNGKCLVWRHQKGGKYLVSDVKYNRAITNYWNEYKLFSYYHIILIQCVNTTPNNHIEFIINLFHITKLPF